MSLLVAAVFVLTETVDQKTVLGYYTLSSSSIPLHELPAPLAKKLPRYPLVPATLLGRMAVHREHLGKRLGARLLMSAMHRTAQQEVASYALLVDALQVEPDPLPFYLKYGFIPFDANTRRLFLPTATIRQLL